MLRTSIITESFRIAFESLRVNPVRSLLTTAGVVVGVVLVTYMGWTIKGLDTIWDRTISIIGEDMMYVDKWDWSGGRRWNRIQYRKDITLQQAEQLCARLESPELAVPLARKWGTRVSYGNQMLSGISVQGTVSSYGLTPAGTTFAGRFFSDVEDRLGQNVAVIGWGVKKAMFPNEDPVGKTVKIKGFPFRIIGVIEQRGFLFLDFIDNQVFIPISTFNAVFGQSDFSYSVAIKAGSTRMMDIVRDEVVGYMREIRNVPPANEDDFSINEMKAFEAQTKQIRYYIWVTGIGLTALAFIVGAIGIMNIMFVSVTERTKEIGIRKAVGAKSSFILTQFLVEAAALCVAGALVAFPISMVLTFTTRFIAINVLEFEAAEVVSPIIQFDLMGIAIGVAIIVGIIAGLAPAIRAASLDPVDALRYE